MCPSDDYRDAAEDFRERRELCGLGDSDGLGCDPTLEPPSLAYSRAVGAEAAESE